MIDIKLRKRLKEEAARETGPMRALKVLEAMRATAVSCEEWTVLPILDRGLGEVRAYIAEDAKRPSYQSDREAIERITVQRDNAEAKVAELQRRLAEIDGHIPPSNASETAPEPPAALMALVERWRMLAQQRRIALLAPESEKTDFGQCAAELEDVLSRWVRVTSVANVFLSYRLDEMTKRAESAERTLELIKENLP